MLQYSFYKYIFLRYNFYRKEGAAMKIMICSFGQETNTFSPKRLSVAEFLPDGWLPAETLVEKVCGVKLFMTHGHLHQVKSGLGALIRDARITGSQAVLFGHTHEPLCRYEDGLWIVNPGSAGYNGGSAAVLEVADGKILDCQLIR
jgi:hypothetical protein